MIPKIENSAINRSTRVVLMDEGVRVSEPAWAALPDEDLIRLYFLIGVELDERQGVGS